MTSSSFKTVTKLGFLDSDLRKGRDLLCPLSSALPAEQDSLAMTPNLTPVLTSLLNISAEFLSPYT